jgi:hypothetical protein
LRYSRRMTERAGGPLVRMGEPAGRSLAATTWRPVPGAVSTRNGESAGMPRSFSSVFDSDNADMTFERSGEGDRGGIHRSAARSAGCFFGRLGLSARDCKKYPRRCVGSVNFFENFEVCGRTELEN